VTTSHFRLFAIVVGLLVSAASSYRVFQLLNPPASDPWTSALYAPELEATADKLEVLVAGVPLGRAIAEGKVVAVDRGTLVPLKASDVKVRLNNEPASRLAAVPSMLLFSALAGGGFVLLVIGILTPLIGLFRPHGLVDLHLTA
jgi:hypothetical protein